MKALVCSPRCEGAVITVRDCLRAEGRRGGEGHGRGCHLSGELAAFAPLGCASRAL